MLRVRVRLRGRGGVRIMVGFLLCIMLVGQEIMQEILPTCHYIVRNVIDAAPMAVFADATVRRGVLGGSKGRSLPHTSAQVATPLLVRVRVRKG